MEDWLAIRESFSARSCIPKKELSCGGSKTQSEGMSKIAVLWFGPGKNLLHFCGSPLHPFPYAQRHPSSCGDPLDLGLGLRSTPLDVGSSGFQSLEWWAHDSCLLCVFPVVRERARATGNLGSFAGKGVILWRKGRTSPHSLRLLVCLSQRTLVLLCFGIGDLISLVSHAIMAVFP